jgi:NAD(P)-dependent dehydrogenase (short-subunit alcohol dehydrogenase family)
VSFYRSKVAVVTGAASGIGRGLAVELSRRGAHLAISDIDEDGLAATAEMCAPARVTTHRLDVADREAVLAHAEEVVSEHGRVNVVVNNAGVAVAGPVEEMSFEDLDWLLGINLMGVVNGTMAFLPHLIDSGAGHVVNLSSVFGLVAPPTQSAYSTAKFGVRGFTESLRQEMLIGRRPVTVHAVHPGGIRTNIARSARVTNGERQSRDEMAAEFDKVLMTTPAKAARTILRGVERNKARILVGPDAYLLAAVPRLLGASYQEVVGRLGRRNAERLGLGPTRPSGAGVNRGGA